MASKMIKRKASERVKASAKRAKIAAETELDWEEFGDPSSKELRPLIYSTNDIGGCEKIAGFDMDGTIITTASGRTFPTSCNDWEFLNDKVPEKMQSLAKDGYKVVIFTNQAGIEKNKTTVNEIQTKISNITNKLGMKMQVFISTGENHFRKPSTLMWDFMVKNHNEEITVDKSKSFYVGDAAGRAKGWSKGKACSSRAVIRGTH